MAIDQRLRELGRSVIDIDVCPPPITGEGYLDGRNVRHPEAHRKTPVIATVVFVAKKLVGVLQFLDYTGFHHCVETKLLIASRPADLTCHIFDYINQLKGISERLSMFRSQLGI